MLQKMEMHITLHEQKKNGDFKHKKVTALCEKIKSPDGSPDWWVAYIRHRVNGQLMYYTYDFKSGVGIGVSFGATGFCSISNARHHIENKYSMYADLIKLCRSSYPTLQTVCTVNPSYTPTL